MIEYKAKDAEIQKRNVGQFAAHLSIQIESAGALLSLIVRDLA